METKLKTWTYETNRLDPPRQLVIDIDDYTIAEVNDVANARLIAAAPDLLEALDSCLAVLHSIPFSAEDHHIANVFEQADAAIQKAEPEGEGK